MKQFLNELLCILEKWDLGPETRELEGWLVCVRRKGHVKDQSTQVKKYSISRLSSICGQTSGHQPQVLKWNLREVRKQIFNDICIL